jgi:hypothetical protein
MPSPSAATEASIILVDRTNRAPDRAARNTKLDHHTGHSTGSRPFCRIKNTNLVINQLDIRPAMDRQQPTPCA